MRRIRPIRPIRLIRLNKQGFLKLTKRSLASLLIFLTVILGTGLIYLFGPWAKKTEAVWFDDNYAYRQEIQLTNSIGSAQTDFQKTLIIDTSTLVTNSKMQSDCDDMRFTNKAGKILKYYLVAGCNTTSTQVYVLIDSIPTSGASIFFYYGNPTATSRSNSSSFDGLTNIVGFWPMNEGTGNTSDASGNANTGTVTAGASGTQTTAASMWSNGSSGRFGSSVNFDGTDDYIQLSDSDTLDMGTGNFTITAWIKTSAAANGRVFSKGSYGCTTGYMVRTSNSNVNIIGEITGGCTSSSGMTATVNNGSWHLVAMTFNRTGNMIGYVDSAQDSSVSISGNQNTVTNTNAPRIGMDDVGVREPFSGQIDDVRVYTGVKTLAQIQALYYDGASVTTSAQTEEKAPSPVAYWSFDDGQGTIAQDKTTNNNDGTISGATWQTEDMYIAGKCLYFDGSNDDINAGSGTSVDNLPNSDFTISSWIKPATCASTRDLVGKNGGGNNGFYWLSSLASCDPRFVVYLSTTTAQYNASSNSITPNVWQHLSVVWTASSKSAKIYVNGKEVSYALQTAGSGTLVDDASYNLAIGNYSPGAVDTRLFQGFIDEPKIYNYARSAAQIQADYNARANNEGASAVLGSSNNNPAALSNGLVGYWKMDDSGVDAEGESSTDSSGNGNTGTLAGDNGVGDNGTGLDCTAAGKFGTGCSLDGTDDYISKSSPTGMPSGGSARTFAAWVKPSVTTQDKVLMAINDTTGGAQSFIFEPSAGASQRIFTDGVNVINNITSTSALTLNSWNHVVFTLDGSDGWKYYINGSLAASGTFGAAISTTSSNVSVSIGRREDGGNTGNYWNGFIDEARVYNRALSSNEISQLYNFAPGPRVFLKMDEGTGTSANDSSGNGRTGTINGNPTWSSGKYGKGIKMDGTGDNVTVSDF